MGPTSSILTKAVGLFVALAPMTAHGHPEHVTSKHQRGPLARMKAAFLAALLIALVAPALADSGQVGNLGNPLIAPPHSHFRGLSYSEWSAAFFQWVYSLPTLHHPLFDTADCSAGQTGKVWFIDGTAQGHGFPTEGRDCTVPVGTALFLLL